MIESVVLESEWSQFFFFQSYHKLKAEHVKKKILGIILLLINQTKQIRRKHVNMSTWYAHKDIIESSADYRIFVTFKPTSLKEIKNPVLKPHPSAPARIQTQVYLGKAFRS